MTDSKPYLQRVKKLQAALKAEGEEGCLIDDAYDLLYLTGLQLSLGYLFVLKNKLEYLESSKQRSS